MQDFRRLDVWLKTHQITLAIYRLTEHFPDDERYGLKSQLRRAASSVPTNIAEGSKRNCNRDYARFLNMAMSSLAEVEYLLILAQDLDYVRDRAPANLLDELDHASRMLNNLHAKVSARL